MKKSTKNLIIYSGASVTLGAVNGAVQAYSSIGLILICALGSLTGLLTWLHYSWTAMELQLDIQKQETENLVSQANKILNREKEIAKDQALSKLTKEDREALGL